MPRSVDEAFRDFLTKLTASSAETGAARSHRKSIEALLRRDFDLLRFFRTGSFGNGTSISGYSDVDYFASLPTEKLKANSDNTLRQVRNALVARFPNTGVRVNCPAVLVPFGNRRSESTEVVPADRIGTTDAGHPLYEIPNCRASWMPSSPDAHNAYVRRVDKELGGKVRPLIRFIKAWKFFRNVPIPSFYLELRVARYAEGESVILYPYDVKRVFSRLAASNLAAMRDPLGISGTIDPCRTSAQFADALSKLETAERRAANALDAYADDKYRDAFYWWDLLWAGRFPSYYY